VPHSLTNRQFDVLEFTRGYIAQNESSPRLEEIASHFKIKLPTAHKLLEELQHKGYLYFGRDKVSGFFIRLIERAGSAEIMVEVILAGRVDGYGELFDFPEEIGHFASVLVGSKPDEVFALGVVDDIPQVNIQAQDLIIFDREKKPQPGDICIAPIGKRLFLVRIYSKTYDREMPSLLMAQKYPIPEKLTDPELGQELNWTPLAYTDENQDYFIQVADEQHWPMRPLRPEFILATALRLIRTLAF
jgi:SOS-response transcriptional repressor LexA